MLVVYRTVVSTMYNIYMFFNKNNLLYMEFNIIL